MFVDFEKLDCEVTKATQSRTMEQLDEKMKKKYKKTVRQPKATKGRTTKHPDEGKNNEKNKGVWRLNSMTVR